MTAKPSMTESEWEECQEPQKMLEFLRNSGRAGERKLRLFACACHRRTWNNLHLFTREVVEVAERLADGLASEDDLQIAYNQAWVWPRTPAPEAGWIASSMALEAAERSSHWVAQHFSLVLEPSRWRDVFNGERAAQTILLRDIFGNPFRPPVIDPSRLTRKDSLVVRLAQAAYDDRVMPAGTLDPVRLAELADTLEDAGCTDAVLLGHLRGPGPHVRGCFAVDLILGKD